MATRCVENTKYYRIEQDIRRRIESGELRPGDRVMSESEICRQYGVSRISAKRALDDLVWEGHIRRVSGSGSYVIRRVSRPDLAGRRGLGLSEEIRRRGMRPGSRLVSFHELSSLDADMTRELLELLALGAGETAFHIRRLRYADDEVIALDDVYIPARHCPGLKEEDLSVTSLHQLLERRFGHAPDRAVETCLACVPEAEQAELLGMAPGEAALMVRHLSYCGENAVVCSTRIYRPGAYEYRVDL